MRPIGCQERRERPPVGVTPNLLRVSTEMSADHQAVREAAIRAAAAAPGVRAAGGAAVDAALRTAADLLRERAGELLAANAADVAAAERNGMAAGLLDRLRLDPGAAGRHGRPARRARRPPRNRRCSARCARCRRGSGCSSGGCRSA